MRNARLGALTAVLLILFLRLNSTRAQETAMVRATEAPPNGVWLDSLDSGRIGASWLRAVAGKSVRNNPISLDDVVYPHGVGTVAMSEFTIDLKGEATRFMSMVGIDDRRRAGLGSTTRRLRNPESFEAASPQSSCRSI